MISDKNQRINNSIYSLIATIYSFIIFIWIFSIERVSLIILFLLLTIFFFLTLIMDKSKLVKCNLDYLFCSQKVYVISIIIIISSLLFFLFILFDLFGKYTHFCIYLLPIIVFLFCLSLETFVFQTIRTNGKIRTLVWQSIIAIRLSKLSKLSILALLISIGFFAAIIVNYYRGVYLNEPYPYNTFLFDPNVRYSDFQTVVNETIGMNPYGKYLSAQYPLLLFISSLFSIFDSGLVYIFFIVSFMIIYYIIGYQFLRIENISASLMYIFIITSFSYPLLFSIDRGNLEMLVFIVLLLFLYCFYKGKYVFAATLLGLAAALKIFPAIFLLLFLKNKKYKEIIIALSVMTGVTLLCLTLFEGGFWKNLDYLLGFSNISSNSAFLSFTSIEKGTKVQRGVSLLSLIKIIVQQFDIPVSQFFTQNFIKIYYVLVTVLFVPIAYYVVFIEKELWKKVALLTISILIFPTLSGDYKLMHMYLPLFLFVHSKKSNRLDLFYIFCFAVLIIPKNYYFLQKIISDSHFENHISLAMPINIIMLIFMAIAIIISGSMTQKHQKEVEIQVATTTL